MATPTVAPTIAVVNQTIANNETWQFPFQFGIPGDLSWNFDHVDLFCDIMVAAGETPLLSTSSLNGDLVIDDPIARIMHYFVQPAVIQSQLPAGAYVYDLIMVNQTTYVTQRLMTGTLTVQEGVTKER